ncbi:MAG: hypothetical protein QOH06_2534 [Acidobacteriota bacterium]|jgi:predicted nucleic acid-binding protein|nr:hypothetical protein [Acidobacteriota bacterium]
MPDAKRIVSDTGPILHLREAGTLDILRAAGQSFIPAAVENEITALDVAWSRDRPEWIETVLLQPLYQGQASDWMKAGLLDPGEAEALALANQLHAEWLLTDDTAARLVASRLGLEARVLDEARGALRRIFS